MISLAFFLSFALFLSSPSSSSSSYVVVLTATQEELDPLLCKLKVYDTPCPIEIAGRQLFLFKNREWVVGATGMGSTNAATLVQALLLHLQGEIHTFFFTGTAGGLDSNRYKVGDTVIPYAWMQHTFQRWLRKDQGCQYNTQEFVNIPTRWMRNKEDDGGYVQFLSDGDSSCCQDKGRLGVPIAIPVGEEEEERFFFPVEPTLHQRVVRKARQAFRIETPRRGVSGDVFLDNRYVAQRIHTQIGADTVDMESTAFMQVCQLNGCTQCVVVRTISDFAGLNITSPINVYKKNADVIAYLLVV